MVTASGFDLPIRDQSYPERLYNSAKAYCIIANLKDSNHDEFERLMDWLTGTPTHVSPLLMRHLVNHDLLSRDGYPTPDLINAVFAVHMSVCNTYPIPQSE